jgi:TetR/AcrR family transcriptional regulator of autoinduction and epiphytic fitness
MVADEVLTKGGRTRQAIIDASYSLFLEHGFSATSMRQIAERVGLALGGIYNHFSSKDEIFQALIIDKHPFVQILPVLLRAPGATADEFIHNAMRLVQQELGEDPNFIKLIFIETVEFKGKHFPKLIETIFPVGFPVIQRFMTQDGGVRANIQAHKLIRVFIGNLMAFYITELLVSESSMPSGLREVTLEDFVDIFLHGILEPQYDQGCEALKKP